MTDYEGIVINNTCMNQKCKFCKEDLKGLANIQIKYGYKAEYICSGCLLKAIVSGKAMEGFSGEANDAKILANLNLIVDLDIRLKEVEDKCAKIPTNRKDSTVTPGKTKSAKKADVVPEVQAKDTVRDTSEQSGRGDGLPLKMS